jgi:hypothetical protein
MTPETNAQVFASSSVAHEIRSNGATFAEVQIVNFSPDD